VGLFRKDEFGYDTENHAYTCPAGQRLHPYSSPLLRGLNKINYVNKLACGGCAIRARCTAGKFRAVSRLENQAVLDRMQARLAKRPGVLDRPCETVEHPFGTIKQWMNQGAFLMRGLEKVHAEFSLTALVYNLRRVLNIGWFRRFDGRGGGLRSPRRRCFGRAGCARMTPKYAGEAERFADLTIRSMRLIVRFRQSNWRIPSRRPRFHTVRYNRVHLT
jgi:hypothetical protein